MKKHSFGRIVASVALASLVLGTLAPLSVVLGQEIAAGQSASAGRSATSSATSSAAPATAPARGRGRGNTPRQPLLEWSAAPMYPLDVTIYEVRVPVDKVGQIDVDKLEKASAVVADFEKGLAELGTSKPLYRITQSVRLDQEDYVQVGSSEPYITNSQVNARGQAINSVAYTQTGAILELLGKESGGAVEVDLRIRLTQMGDAGVPVGGEIKAPNFRTATLMRKAPVKPKQPFVIMSVDASSPDANGKAVAYFARVVLGAPEASVVGK
jgi:hypothetical protein